MWVGKVAESIFTFQYTKTNTKLLGIRDDRGIRDLKQVVMKSHTPIVGELFSGFCAIKVDL